MDARTPAEILDDPATYALDRSGMFTHIANVGAGLERAWRASASFGSGIERAPRAVVVAGIGGSATAGDYFAAIAAPESKIPVLVAQGYDLPAWVGPGVLVAVCSYSGNTAETLSAYRQAVERGAGVVAITSGGELEKDCAARGFPVCRIDYQAPPRATTVHTLAPLLRLGAATGLTGVHGTEIADAAEAHRALTTGQLSAEVPFAANPAKQLAASLVGRVPLILGSGHLIPAAIRFKNQLAENGKMLAAADAVPEAGHNVVVGLADGAKRPGQFAAVFLRAHSVRAEIASRIDAVAGQFAEAGIEPAVIEVEGGSPLADLLLVTAWGDYVSCYVAMLNGEDPTPIPQIERVRAYPVS
jgi:glucose/mannose-6-phosphate isomerase